jgi:hypothetical protein
VSQDEIAIAAGLVPALIALVVGVRAALAARTQARWLDRRLESERELVRIAADAFVSVRCSCGSTSGVNFCARCGRPLGVKETKPNGGMAFTRPESSGTITVKGL